jgi:hypothetical protein
MSGKTTTEKDQRQEDVERRHAEITEIMARAEQGDLTVLPALRKLLDDDPYLWVQAGNVAALARQAWIKVISGNNLLLRESLVRDSYAMVNDVAGPNASRMERILAERIVMCRLQTHQADAALASAGPDLSPKMAVALDKRIAECQKRLTLAVDALVQHRKVLGKTISVTAQASAPTVKPAMDETAHDPVATAREEPVATVVSAASLDMSEKAIEERIRREFEQLNAQSRDSDATEAGHHNQFKNRITEHLTASEE